MAMRSLDATHFDVKVDHVRYILERFTARIYFDESVLRTMKMEAIEDFRRDQMVYQLSMMVAAWREQRILRVPANWWEHFKQRWFPAWALKRWPVLTTAYDAIDYLPRVPIPHPQMGSVEFQVLRPSPLEAR